MNNYTFDSWLQEQLNNFQSQQTNKKSTKFGIKSEKRKVQNIEDKEFTQLIQLFDQLSLSDKQYQLNKQILPRIDFTQQLDISNIQERDTLEWYLKQLKFHFNQKKINELDNKLEFLFKLIFNEKEIAFLYDGLCERLDLKNQALNKEEKIAQIRILFNNIFQD